jgi:hypothetical protein
MTADDVIKLLAWKVLSYIARGLGKGSRTATPSRNGVHINVENIHKIIQKSFGGLQRLCSNLNHYTLSVFLFVPSYLIDLDEAVYEWHKTGVLGLN